MKKVQQYKQQIIIFTVYIDKRQKPSLKCNRCICALLNVWLSMMLYMSLSQPLILNSDKLRLEMARLESFTKTAISPLLGNGKHFPFLYFKGTVVIPLDNTGYRNFHRHSSINVLATTFKQMPYQLLTTNNNQWKSITFRRIGEGFSIFIDWLTKSILINRFSLIILIEISDWFSLIVIVCFFGLTSKTIKVTVIFCLTPDFAKSLQLKRISLQSIFYLSSPFHVLSYALTAVYFFFAKTPQFFIFFLTKAFQACFHIKFLLKRASFVEKWIWKGCNNTRQLCWNKFGNECGWFKLKN